MMLISVRFVIFILLNGSIGLSHEEEGDTPGPNSCREVDIDGRCHGLAPANPLQSLELVQNTIECPFQTSFVPEQEL
jgi:hypothetical protein